MKIKALMLAVAAFAAAGSAQAVGVGARVGTTGIGADFGFSVAPTLLARVGYGYLNYSHSVDQTDVSYDGRLKISTASLLLDWSPLGPFRITAGLMPNNNKVELTGRPTNGTYTLNGRSYQASDIGSLSGEVKAGNSVAPYVGIGYGNVATAGVNFYFDLGVMYMGTPKSSMSAACGASLSTTDCNQLRSDVAAEQQRLTDDLKYVKWYPVANIGVTIGF
jgi:hypothetical protein